MDTSGEDELSWGGDRMRIDEAQCLREDGGHRAGQGDWESGSGVRGRELGESGLQEPEGKAAMIPSSWTVVRNGNGQRVLNHPLNVRLFILLCELWPHNLDRLLHQRTVLSWTWTLQSGSPFQRWEAWGPGEWSTRALSGLVRHGLQAMLSQASLVFGHDQRPAQPSTLGPAAISGSSEGQGPQEPCQGHPQRFSGSAGEAAVHCQVTQGGKQSQILPGPV